MRDNSIKKSEEKIISKRIIRNDKIENSFSHPNTKIGVRENNHKHITSSKIEMNTYVEELSLRCQSQALKIEEMRRENERLSRDSKSLTLVQSRLDEKMSENGDLYRRIESSEALFSELQNNLSNKQLKINELSNQLNDIIKQSNGRLQFEGNKILSAQEFLLQKNNKALEDEILFYKSEIENLSCQNYEYRRLMGEDGNDTNYDDELAEKKYN